MLEFWMTRDGLVRLPWDFDSWYDTEGVWSLSVKRLRLTHTFPADI